MSMFNAKLQALRNEVELRPVYNPAGQLMRIDVPFATENQRGELVETILELMEPRYRFEFFAECFSENAIELSLPVMQMMKGDVGRFTNDFSRYIAEYALLLLWNETVEPLSPAEQAEIEADDRNLKNWTIAAGIVR